MSEASCPQFGDECWRNNGCPSVPPVAPPPASPEPMPSGWNFGGVFVKLEAIRLVLAEHGLHIVDESSANVLEAMAAVPRETLERSLANTLHGPEHSRAPAAAELARREKEKRNA